MGHFESDLDTRLLKDGRTRKLLAPLVYVEGDTRLEVPVDFKTDYASIPRIFWAILPPSGKYSPAAVLHDKLYETGEYPKEVADKIFRDAMGSLGVKPWKIFVMYQAVDKFGGRAWRKCRAADSVDT